MNVFGVYDGNPPSWFKGFFNRRQAFCRNGIVGIEYIHIGRLGVNPGVNALYFLFSEFFVRYFRALVNVIPQALFAFEAVSMQHESQFRMNYDDVFSEMGCPKTLPQQA